MKDNSMTHAWKLYQDGVNYNRRLVPDQYQTVKTNTEFFIGNQWLHLPDTPAMKGLAKPTFNILKRVASLFIASMTSSGVTLRFEPLAYYDGGAVEDPNKDAAAFANAEIESLLEKFKFDYRIREALFDGAQTGDYCAHFYFDPEALPYGGAFGAHKGEIKMEMVDGINVMFGNPNTRDVQSQPYILLVGRENVEVLEWEREQFRKHRFGKGGKAGDKSTIAPDMDYELFAGIGGQTEIAGDDDSGKALYVYLYTKVMEDEPVIDPATGETTVVPVVDENGDPVMEKANGILVPKTRPVTRQVPHIHVTKATKSAVIYEDVDTGLSYYPVAWGNWEKQKNQYHGRALVTGLLPNQIFINSMFATAMRHLQLSAFQKTVYNADLISSWSNEVGQAIAVHGLQPGQAIGTVAQVLPVAEMSGQIFALIDKAMEYTKECLGATDAQMGNIKNPENTSALMVLQTNSEVPLENIRSNLYEWAEDIGVILLDMIGTYYGTRPIIVDKDFDEPIISPSGAPQLDPNTGMIMTQHFVRKVKQEFDFSVFKHLPLNLRVDAGATTYFSEIAMTQTLDNLRKDGTLDVIQYLERLPDKLIPKKQELLDELRGRIAQGLQANAAAGAAIPEAGTPVSAAGGEAPAQGGMLSEEKALQGLPTQAEAGYGELPNIAKKTALAMGDMRVT